MEDQAVWLQALDSFGGQRLADALVENRRERMRQDAVGLAMVARWCDLHNGDSLPATRSKKPGRERAVELGGDGTPAVREFAVMELACLLQVSNGVARNLMRDAMDIRHRHPLLQASVDGLRAQVWQARKIATAVRAAGLDLDRARWVDAQITDYVHTLPWPQFLDLLAAKIIEADPEAAEQRRVAAAVEQFVATGRSTEFGLKTIIARAQAGDVIFFVAMLDRIAQILLLEGDPRPVGVRRAAALGVLANPARALELLDTYTPTRQGHGPGTRPGIALPPAPADDPTTGIPVGEHEMHPADNDADDTHELPAPAQPVDATCGPAAFVKPPQLTTDQLRQDAVLYVHVSQDTFDAVRAANTGGGLATDAVAGMVAGVVAGVARVEGIGPVTDRQAQEFLGHCNVTTTRVLDVAGQAPVDGYEVPPRITEALQLRHPTTVEPYSPASARAADTDHTERYVPRDQGGEPGQTAIDNLGRLTRFGHRVKTHAPGWQHHQPLPGIYLWRTPHGYWFRVDNTGTHHLGKNPDLTAYRLPEPKARPPQLAPT